MNVRPVLVGAACVAISFAAISQQQTDTPRREHPRHAQPTDRVGDQAEAPGSNLEGIRAPLDAITYANAAYQHKIAVDEQAQAEAQAVLDEQLAHAQAQQAELDRQGAVLEEATATVDTSGASPWDAVAVCETGGNWQMQGSSFSGGLGFANSTWDAYGGQEFASNAGLATREQQIIVAERIQSNPPDQNGCTGGW